MSQRLSQHWETETEENEETMTVVLADGTKWIHEGAPDYHSERKKVYICRNEVDEREKIVLKVARKDKELEHELLCLRMGGRNATENAILNRLFPQLQPVKRVIRGLAVPNKARNETAFCEDYCGESLKEIMKQKSRWMGLFELVLKELRKAVDDLLSIDWWHSDLHPGNITYDVDFGLCFVDPRMQIIVETPMIETQLANLVGELVEPLKPLTKETVEMIKKLYPAWIVEGEEISYSPMGRWDLKRYCVDVSEEEPPLKKRTVESTTKVVPRKKLKSNPQEPVPGARKKLNYDPPEPVPEPTPEPVEAEMEIEPPEDKIVETRVEPAIGVERIVESGVPPVNLGESWEERIFTQRIVEEPVEPLRRTSPEPKEPGCFFAQRFEKLQEDLGKFMETIMYPIKEETIDCSKQIQEWVDDKCHQRWMTLMKKTNTFVVRVYKITRYSENLRDFLYGVVDRVVLNLEEKARCQKDLWKLWHGDDPYNAKVVWKHERAGKLLLWLNQDQGPGVPFCLKKWINRGQNERIRLWAEVEWLEQNKGPVVVSLEKAVEKLSLTNQ